MIPIALFKMLSCVFLLISRVLWKVYLPFQGGASFVDHFCYLCFVLVMFSCLFIAALWLPAGKGLISWLSCMYCFIVFLSLSHVVWYLNVSISDLCHLSCFV